MADEWVYMEHPSTTAIGRALKSSFDELWKDKGWKVTTDYELVTDPETGVEQAVKPKAAAALRKES